MASDAKHWEAVEEVAELLRDGQYEEALRALRHAIREDPENPYAYNQLGSALLDLGQLDPAADAFAAALQLAPRFLAARVGLSHALRLHGELDGAVAQAEQALRQFPGDADALRVAGLAHAASGQLDEARQRLGAYLGTDPELGSQPELRAVLAMLGLDGEGEPTGS
ncbi:MAG: tetratricopeptide repeat protein [Deltaproteobacteria bacterium]|nr:tetratricopeptide repeat protein [Deltaproteobacteria bacterium]